ncbi:MAG: hypothetical protein JRJ09_17210 [Deltaproteobacteria bacterium]|nr:hypothetical protein [Deltaproteobacteria bacterium]MBW2354245.1 hypothetical protein [Deltaproteobacteria bacterium]
MKRSIFLLKAVWALFLLALLLCPVINAGAGEGGKVPLKLRKVALFKSGVGYFELRGSVESGKGVRLHFRREQMNDILKSLTVLDSSGEGVDGYAISVVYDSTKTAEQQLSDFAFNLKRGDGLPQVLEQLQGTRVELIVGSTSVTGTVVGVEKRVSRDSEMEIPDFYLCIMDNDGHLRSFNTGEIGAVRFLDKRLNQDISRYLSILFQKHRKDEKTVVITSTGAGMGELSISYVTEVPVWKATYRIIIPEDGEDLKPFLQGWAIVDNVTGEDWKDVRLSLISGLPISFVQDLYDPLFRKRPVVKMEREALMAPPVPEAGMRADRMASFAAPAPESPGKRRRLSGPRMEMRKMVSGESEFDRKMRELKTDTVTMERGEMFEYRIVHPVTIERNRSALVPIVAAEIEGQAVDLYNQKVRPRNPLAAIRLKNSTGLTLEGGPLTVFQGSGYAGDALIKTFKPTEQRYITYAVDLGILVNTKTGTKTEEIDRVIINRGVIRMRRGVVETRTYNLDNRNTRPKTVVIEHPYHPDWKLLNRVKPIEITDNYIRFQVEAPAQKVTSFSVREMRESWERIIVGNLTPDQITVMAQKRYLTKGTQKKLQEIVALKSKISTINKRLEAIQKERKQIFSDQKRVRENLRGLGQTTGERGLRNRYVKLLDQQETRLGEMQRREKELNRELRIRQEEMEKMIEDLEQDLRVEDS